MMGGPGKPRTAVLPELPVRAAPCVAAALARPEHGPGLKLHTGPAPSPSHATVLVVDDDPDVLTMVGKHIEKAGYQAVKAENAHAALRVIGSGRPLAAIVTDYAMPGMNGAQLLTQVALLRPGLPALIVTGYADSAGMEILGTGVEVVRKPFMRAESIATVHRLVAAGQAAVALSGPALLDPYTPGFID